MATSDWPVLPGQVFFSDKAPEFNTGIKRAVSGREHRNPRWSYPIWRFEAGWEFLRDRAAIAELLLIKAFFSSVLGAGNTFYYLDPNDNAVTGAPGVGVADGTNRVFQLSRTMTATAGGVTKSFTEPVAAINGSPTVKVNGVTKSGATYVLSGGIVTFNSGQQPTAGQVVTWDGSFLFLCRFSDDKLELKQLFRDLWEAGTVRFESVKP